MKLNTKPKFTETTHEGAPAARMTPEQALRRSVMSCLLWEREFYEDGEAIADRIERLCGEVEPFVVSNLAREARTTGLRHVPLLLLCGLIKHGKGDMVASAIEEVIQRADELTELLAIYWRKGKTPLSNPLKRGLAAAFTKFDAYQLAKYNRDGAVKLRDVLFLSHAKPKDEEQAAVWKQLIEGTLPAPDTWEVALSGGADKKEAFERLLTEGKLGYLALLRNLRGMMEAGVDDQLVRRAILERKGGADKVLPFRFVAAARAVPRLEPELDKAMAAGFEQMPKLPGKTVLIVDASGSMWAPLSAKSDMTRQLAANALAAIIRGTTEEAAIYATAGNDSTRKHATELVPSRQGMALIDAIVAMRGTIGGGGIFLKDVMDHVFMKEKTADRVIVITDEQDCSIDADAAPAKANAFGKRNYLINVASAKNGVGYGRWTHIDGFSENVLRYIHELEAAGDE